MKAISRALLLGSSLLGLAGCNPANIQQVLDGQRPTVSVADQRLTRLDFERVNLAFDIQVDNPNPVGVQLAGLDYELKLGGHSFAQGNQAKQMQLRASGPSRFELPLSLGLRDIYQGLAELKGRDEIPYELTTGLMIDVPLLGKLRYPVTASGTLPLPKLPTVSLKSLSVERLTFNGATVAVKLGVDNPNAFGVALDALQYDLTVNGKRWASGNGQGLGNIARNQGSELTLPITLNFMELGSGLYNLLSSGQELNYSLSGRLDATGSHPLIGKFDMPIDNSGKVRLTR